MKKEKLGEAYSIKNKIQFYKTTPLYISFIKNHVILFY